MVEFLKDYDFELKYHPGKANVVEMPLAESPFICPLLE